MNDSTQLFHPSPAAKVNAAQRSCGHGLSGRSGSRGIPPNGTPPKPGGVLLIPGGRGIPILGGGGGIPILGGDRGIPMPGGTG